MELTSELRTAVAAQARLRVRRRPATTPGATTGLTLKFRLTPDPPACSVRGVNSNLNLLLAKALLLNSAAGGF